MQNGQFGFIFCLLWGSAHSQSFSVGGSFGWHQDNGIITENNGKLRQGCNILNLAGQIDFTRHFKNKLELTTGFGSYNLTCLAVMKGASTKMEVQIYTSRNFDIPVLYLPVRVGYPIPLGRNFHLHASGGIEVALYLGYGEGWGGGRIGELSVHEYTSGVLNTRVNLLLTQRMALRWDLHPRITLSLFASHGAGLFRVFDQAWAECVWNAGTPGEERLYTRFISYGSQWRWGVEARYKFGKKKE